MIRQNSDLELPDSKSQRTRLRLVRGIRDELESAGGFTADAVSRRSGSSPATFYNHFASKDAALVAVFSAAMDDLVEFVRETLQIERVLELGLEAFAELWVAASIDFFRTNRVVFSAAQTRLPASEALKDLYRNREAEAFEIYERFVRLGQTAKVFREGDARSIARGMMISSQGWNNPAVFRLAPGDELHAELSTLVVRMLESRP